MSTLAINKMNTFERLQAMEALWDALLQDEGNVQSPGWHRDILEERKKKIASGEAKFLSLSELKKRLR